MYGGFDLTAGSSLGQKPQSYSVNSPRAMHTPRPTASPPPYTSGQQTPYQRAMSTANNLAESWSHVSWPSSASQKTQQRETLSPGPAPSTPYSYPKQSPTPSASTAPLMSYTPAATSNKSSNYSSNTPARTTTSTPASQGGLALASKFKFNDREVDRIAAQLHAVQKYQTTGHLVVHAVCLLVGVVVLLYACLSPMTWLSTSFPIGREAVQITLALIGAWMSYTGAVGLHLYSSLQLPLREMEGLTDRQKALMGWQTGNGTSSSRGSGFRSQQRYPTSQEEAAANDRMRRRRVESQIAPTPIASPPPSNRLANPPAVPSASLRFLNEQSTGQQQGRNGFGSPTGLRGIFGSVAQSLSPFKTRGLDSRAVNDETSLQGFVNEFSSRREDANASAALLTPPSNRYGSSLSPRNGSGFGMGSGYPSLSTPPYATSTRESTPAVPMPVSSSGAPGVQPFTLPGLRYALDDPRADTDLHDVFHSQLLSLRMSTQELDVSVRRVRAWMVSTILRPFLRSLDQTAIQMAQLAKMVLSQANVNQFLQPDDITLLKEYLQITISNGPTQSPPAPTQRTEEAISLMRVKFAQRPECAARAVVEQMLQVQVPDSSAGLSSSTSSVTKSVSPAVRAFVARRLLQLCAPGDDSLSKYSVQQSLNGVGIGAAGQRSTQLFGGLRSNSLANASAQAAATTGSGPNAFPTDDKILLHVICTHLETVTPGFAQQYVRDASTTPNLGVGSLPRPTQGAAACIVQVRPAQLPSYYIVARAPTTAATSTSRTQPSAVKWVTEPGRPSLFQAIVLWIRELGVGSRLAREFTALVD